MAGSIMLRVWAERAAGGDKDAERRAIADEALQKVLQGIAKEWRIPGLEHSDIVQEATIAALVAIREFDPNRGSSVEAFVRTCVTRHLGHVKDSARRRQAEPIAEELIEAAVAVQPPAAEPEAMDPDIIRQVWPYLKEAERRGVIVVLMETEHATAAHLGGVSKQAINKGWKSAQALIRVAHEDTPELALAGRKMVGPLEGDWQLDYALERLGHN